MPLSLLASPLVQPSSPAGTIRVAIAHGQRLVRAGLRVLLECEPGIEVVEAATGDEIVELAGGLQLDVVLIDVRLPGIGCVQATQRILAGPPVAVVVLAATEADGRVFATLKAGASGMLLEDREPAALVRAIRQFGRGPRVRARRPRQVQRSREVHMLTPKVTELRRGCAHAAVASLPKSGAKPAA
jgi:DNA-binding NarL/FixJ family response regulator